MANDGGKVDRSPPRWIDPARRAAMADSDRFDKLAEILGLDPANDFWFADLTGVDFGGSNLHGFDLTGARLIDCSFAGARIAGGTFDQAELGANAAAPLTDLTAAADYATFAATYLPSLRAPKDLSHLPGGTVYFVAPGVTRTRGAETLGAGTDRGLRLMPQAGHTNWVNSVAVTPNGRQIVSASDDHTVKVWDAGSGRLLRTLEGQRSRVTAVAFTPDGRQIISGSWDDTVKVWEAGSGRLLRTLEGHRNSVTSVIVTPDSRQIVSGSHDGTVKVWEAGSGRLLRTLEGHKDSVTSVIVTPDGRQIVSGSWDKTVKVWDAGSGRLLRTLEGHTDWVTALAVTPDGRQVVSGSHDGTVKVWDAGSGRLLCAFGGHRSRVTSVAVTPDGRQIVAGSHDGIVRVWDDGSGRLLRMFGGHKNWFTSVAVTPDGRAVVSRDSGRKDYRWNLATGARSHASSKDKALLTAIRKRHRGLRITGGDLHLAAPDGSSRACLITLPGGHWIALLADGLTYTGSDECEAHMQVVEGFEARDLDADFIAAHRRDKLDIDWP